MLQITFNGARRQSSTRAVIPIDRILRGMGIPNDGNTDSIYVL